jgi:hypothetical protein
MTAMSEAKRRRSRIARLLANGEQGQIKGARADVCAEAADYWLERSVDRTLLVSPVAWRPSDGTSALEWYFIVVGCDRTGEMRHDQLFAETEADTVVLRADVMAALAAYPPCVLHAFDDELAMAKLAEILWPCAKITSIRERIEAKRAAWKEAVAALEAWGVRRPGGDNDATDDPAIRA